MGKELFFARICYGIWSEYKKLDTRTHTHTRKTTFVNYILGDVFPFTAARIGLNCEEGDGVKRLEFDYAIWHIMVL